MSVSNVTDLTERRETSPNRHSVRGPNGRWIAADPLDEFVAKAWASENPVFVSDGPPVDLVAQRQADEADDLRAVMRAPRHHVVSPDVCEAALLESVINSKLTKAVAAVVVLALLYGAVRFGGF